MSALAGDPRCTVTTPRRGLAVALLIPLLAAGCRTIPPDGDPDDAPGRARRAAVARQVEALRSERPALAIDARGTSSDAVRGYFRYYGLDLPVPHAFGYVDTAVAPVAVHVFRPEGATATAFFLHGYYDHVGYHARTISALVDAGLAVVAIDLPGHGLSGGAPAEIDSIRDYGVALGAVCAAVEGSVPAPWHFVGYSMGCTAVIDPLLRRGDAPVPFERIVLVAPLVRSAWWAVSRFGVAVVGAFADDVPRFLPPGSPDPAVGRFRRFRDPLQHDRFPLGWFAALETWQEEMRDATPVERAILVLQGESDDTIDLDWNLAFIAEKFPRAEIATVPDGEHELLNERPWVRDGVIGAVAAALAVPGER